LSAMRKELHSAKWFWFTIAYELVIAYLISLAIYQIGSLPTGTLIGVLVGILALIAVSITIRHMVKAKTCESCVNCKTSGYCQYRQNENTDQRKHRNQNERRKGENRHED